MSYVPRLDVEISVDVDVKQAGWASSAVQSGMTTTGTT